MGRWNPDAIERQLAHQEANAVRRAYTYSAEYWRERVLMMQAWADYLDELREGGKVGPLIQGPGELTGDVVRRAAPGDAYRATKVT